MHFLEERKNSLGSDSIFPQSRACTDTRENELPSDGSGTQLSVEVKLPYMGINQSSPASMREAAILRAEKFHLHAPLVGTGLGTAHGLCSLNVQKCGKMSMTPALRRVPVLVSGNISVQLSKSLFDLGQER